MLIDDYFSLVLVLFLVDLSFVMNRVVHDFHVLALGLVLRCLDGWFGSLC